MLANLFSTGKAFDFLFFSFLNTRKCRVNFLFTVTLDLCLSAFVCCCCVYDLGSYYLSFLDRQSLNFMKFPVLRLDFSTRIPYQSLFQIKKKFAQPVQSHFHSSLEFRPFLLAQIHKTKCIRMLKSFFSAWNTWKYYRKWS